MDFSRPHAVTYTKCGSIGSISETVQVGSRCYYRVQTNKRWSYMWPIGWRSVTFKLIHLMQVLRNVICFVQMCSSWQDVNWHSASRGPSAIAELLVIFSTAKDIAILFSNLPTSCQWKTSTGQHSLISRINDNTNVCKRTLQPPIT